jgi:hypothetical protein
MKKWQRWGAALGALAMTACGAEANSGTANDGLQTQPLSTIRLSPTHVVEIFEVADGEFLYAEQTGADDEPIDVDVFRPETLSGLYERISPDHVVPEHIARATLRQMAAVQKSQVPGALSPISALSAAEPVATEGIVPKEAPRDTNLFRANECRRVGEKSNVTSGPVTVDAASCLTERSGDGYTQISNAHAAQAVTRVYRGTLTAKFRHDFGSGWVVDRTISLGENGSWRVWRFNTSDRFTLRLDISNATDDGYHMASFGSGSTNSTVMACYDGGYHCGLRVVIP